MFGNSMQWLADRSTSSELMTFAANSAAREAPRAAEDSSPVYISPWSNREIEMLP